MRFKNKLIVIILCVLLISLTISQSVIADGQWKPASIEEIETYDIDMLKKEYKALYNEYMLLLKNCVDVNGVAAKPRAQTGTPIAYRGDVSELVTEIQRNLRDLGYTTDAPDRVFGPNTESALIAFLEDYGYEVTETVHVTDQTLDVMRALSGRDLWTHMDWTLREAVAGKP